jgi:hypothetical protein
MRSDETLEALIDTVRRRAPEYLDLLTACNDASFEAAFAPLLERALHGLEANGKNFVDLDEEGLTATLALALSTPGVTVTQETNSNGHVDLTIRADHCFPARIKLGEAKIYDGPEKHFGGLEQLLSRYTTGREGRGLLITYVRKADIAGLLKKLRERMDAELPSQQQGAAADLPIKWSFLTGHAHTCGQMLEVCHVGCNLFVGR